MTLTWHDLISLADRISRACALQDSNAKRDNFIDGRKSQVRPNMTIEQCTKGYKEHKMTIEQCTKGYKEHNLTITWRTKGYQKYQK